MERYKLDYHPFSRTPNSVLFLCTDTVTGERLIVKTVDRRLTSGERRVRLLLSGSQLVSRAGTHKHITKVRAIYDVNGKAFVVMDYAAGGTLLSYIRRRGPLTEDRAVVIVRQLLEAIVHLHAAGVMHRDIKAENILIQAPVDGKHPPTSVCISDFGFATFCGPSNECVGSPAYCSPEIALIGINQGHKVDEQGYTYNEKCDVWALGVVVYAMLSGLLPYGPGTPTQVFSDIVKGQLQFPQTSWSHVTEEGKNFVRFLMTFEEKKRPSAREALNHSWLVR
ncbi:Protein kinase domain [Trypanosoma vivax]|uniref:Protein kinase domain-containing protein n=1 Tax=Trypanosoma vivax (strain Y486) TaxID=1055687 RepID=G0TS42_TRYVY|nr:putative protein kinase [Trypanosoma vivax]KAH8615904.1 Protein kinase domain [Trypanosoma vivax]CCC46766.1 putative protein kinase [Trypanosoma vivax Y486]